MKVLFACVITCVLASCSQFDTTAVLAMDPYTGAFVLQADFHPITPTK